MHATECIFQPGAPGVPDPQAHGGGLVLCADDNIGFTVEGKVRLSAVDSTIELACTGVAHKARAALSD